MMKAVIYLLFIITICSCAPKVTEGTIYVSRKYIGKVQECIPMRMPINLPNSTIVITDSMTLKISGTVDIPKGVHCYVRFERPYYIRDCKGMLEIGNQEFIIK